MKKVVSFFEVNFTDFISLPLLGVWKSNFGWWKIYMWPFYKSADLADSAEISAATGPYFWTIIFSKSCFFQYFSIDSQGVNRQTNPFITLESYTCVLPTVSKYEVITPNSCGDIYSQNLVPRSVFGSQAILRPQGNPLRNESKWS